MVLQLRRMIGRAAPFQIVPRRVKARPDIGETPGGEVGIRHLAVPEAAGHVDVLLHDVPDAVVEQQLQFDLRIGFAKPGQKRGEGSGGQPVRCSHSEPA